MQTVYLGIHRHCRDEGCCHVQGERYREPVYVHDDGKVYYMMFEWQRDGSGELAGDEIPTLPVLHVSDRDKWFIGKRID